MTDERCKNIPIEPCCAEFEDVLMMNDIRESLIYFDDTKEVMIWWNDGDCTPLRYCPCCGKKIKPR